MNAVVVLLFVASTASSQVEVRKLGDDRFLLIVADVGVADERLAQAMVAPTADRVCAPKVPTFGKFVLNGQVIPASKKRPKPFRFEQNVICIDQIPIADGVSGAGFVATKADEAAAAAAALTYFRLRDAGDIEQFLLRITPSQRAIKSSDDWKRDIGSFNRALGRDVARRVVKLSWYIDPPGIPPGVYVAADMAGNSSEMAYICGYVAMRRSPDGTYGAVREESGTIPRTSVKGASPETLAKLKETVRCVEP